MHVGAERASLMGTPQSHSSAALVFLEASSGRIGRGTRGEKLLRASVTPAVMEGTYVSAAPVPSGCPQKTAHSS